MKHTLLIADDHTLFNEGVKQLLSDHYEIVAQVYDGKEVLPTIHLKNPDVILLDINLPSINGFDLAEEIKRSFESLKIIFLSMYDETKFIEQSQQLQVHGYMLKHSTKEELTISIESVLAGTIYYDPKLKKSQTNLHHDDFFVKQFSLTPREIEIIKLIKTGMDTAKIAEKLFLSEETIKSHRKNIYFKLNINKVAELIAFADKNGI
jgi:DNA-binding NarL/FixJ family response regulator